MPVTAIGLLVRPDRLAFADSLRAAHPGHDFPAADSAGGLRPALGRLDGLVVATPMFDAALAAALRDGAPRLRWVQALSSGVDSILKHGLPPGVALCSAAGAHADPVADHAMALLLALFRGIPDFVLGQAERRWATGEQRHRLREIACRRATVLGYGHIGRGIARRLRAFGATVTAVNRSGRGEGEAHLLLPATALDAALEGADILILCLPGETVSRPPVDGRALDLLAPGAVVVNVGRGSALDAAALVDRLRAGRLSGAALDVFDREPLAPGDPLWSVAGLIVSPHVGGNGHGVTARLDALVAENTRRFLAGQPLLNQILPAAGGVPHSPATPADGGR